MILQLIQIQFFPVTLCILFTLYIMADRCFNQKIRMYFIGAICTILCLIAVDSIEYVEIQRQHPTILRYVDTSLGYMIRPLIAMSVSAIFVESTKQNISKVKKILYLIPYFINVAAVITSPWNHLVYSFSDSNEFVRGPVGYITFVVGFLYMGMMLYISIRSVKFNRNGDTFVVVMMVVLCVAGTEMESVYGLTGLLAMASIIGVVLYYLFLHVSVFSRDELTGAYNRRLFFLDLQKLKKSCTMVSMDLNNLKKLNDTEGHQKGDEFLMSFAEEVFRMKPKGTHLYRMGGDEFALLCKKLTEGEAVELMEKLEKNLSDRGYSFAYGATTLQNKEDAVRCMKQADERMYQKKSEMKAKAAIRKS